VVNKGAIMTKNKMKVHRPSTTVSKKKKRILLIGQNPDCFSGNGNMLGACYDDINKDEYQVCAFVKDEVPLALLGDPFKSTSTIGCNTIVSHDYTHNDPWGKFKLLQLLNTIKMDQIIFIGLDIWRYAEIFPQIKDIQKRNPFIWKMLIPYDLDHIRNDWLHWIEIPDQVYIYSEFGHRLVDQLVPSVKYYRPKLRFNDIYQPLEKAQIKQTRLQFFGNIPDDTLLFTYVGNNQFRKNIYNIVDGFARALQKRQNMLLYMHLNDSEKIFNIEALRKEFDISTDNLRHNGKSRKLWPHELAIVYAISDCHVLPSLQEGLSWTVVESKLCGVPSILSDSTAHKDFITLADKIDCSQAVFPIQSDTVQFLPLITEHGPNHVSVHGCSAHAVMEGFLSFKKDEAVQKQALKLGRHWIGACNNFNELLNDIPEVKPQVLGEIL
jgi:glycosyltransferase involved in cell wall biosynthesis